MGIPLDEIDGAALEELRLELYCPDRPMAFAPWRQELEALGAKAPQPEDQQQQGPVFDKAERETST